MQVCVGQPMRGRTQELYWYKDLRNSLRNWAQSSFSLATIISLTKQGNNGFSLDHRHAASGIDRIWEDRAIHHESGAFVFLRLDWIVQLHYCCPRMPASLISTQKPCSNRVSPSWKSTRTTFPLVVHWKPFKQYTPIWLVNRITDRKKVMGNW